MNGQALLAELAAQLRVMAVDAVLSERRGKAVRIAPILLIADQLDELADRHDDLLDDDHLDLRPVEVSVAVAAAALGITRQAVCKRIRAGSLQARRVGRAWLVSLPQPRLDQRAAGGEP